MNKFELNVPKGTRYVSEIEGFKLPNGILNKGVPGCGATTLALEDEHKTIICSPRNNLLLNKNEQYPDSFLVIGGVEIREIQDYIARTEIPKILVSYDGIYKITKCLEDKSNWRVVVDEFQYILSDSSFKSEIEQKLLTHLKAFPYVTYLSATPILDKYLEQIDYFNDIDYYQMNWEDRQSIKVERKRSPHPINAAIEIVRAWQRGEYPMEFVDGEIVYSKECDIYVNSVKNIVSVIKKTGLSPEEVNIIVADTKDNDIKIAQLGEGYKRGRVPLKGEPHKKFTFCTSTAFAGCDFYSTSASTFVISDCKRINTTIDIGTDLVQIAGRQRLDCNPFRKYLTFIFNVNRSDMKEAEFWAELKKKVDLTDREVKVDNAETDELLRAKRIKDCLRLQKQFHYQDSYTMYDSLTDTFQFNKLAYINEQYCYELQRHNYIHGVIVSEQLKESNFELAGNQLYCDYKEQIDMIIDKKSFADRMKHYCECKSKSKYVLCIALDTGKEYDRCRFYYEELGGKRIKALGYKEKKLKNELKVMKTNSEMHYKLRKVLLPNMRITTDKIKELMNETYQAIGVDKKGKASDLINLYGFKIKPCKVPMGNGSVKNGFLIEAV